MDRFPACRLGASSTTGGTCSPPVATETSSVALPVGHHWRSGQDRGVRRAPVPARRTPRSWPERQWWPTGNATLDVSVATGGEHVPPVVEDAPNRHAGNRSMCHGCAPLLMAAALLDPGGSAGARSRSLVSPKFRDLDRPPAPADAGYPADRGVDQDRPAGGPRALGRPPSPAGRGRFW